MKAYGFDMVTVFRIQTKVPKNKDVSLELIEILACPKCKGAIKQRGDVIECLRPVCGLCFPVRNGIPIMLMEEEGMSATVHRVGDSKVKVCLLK